jgi:hypothetical protein
MTVERLIMSVSLDKSTTEPQSGYTPCACRDCMDTTVSSDTARRELCEACEDAGCTNHSNLPGFMAGYGLGYECQRDDAYAA